MLPYYMGNKKETSSTSSVSTEVNLSEETK